MKLLIITTREKYLPTVEKKIAYDIHTRVRYNIQRNVHITINNIITRNVTRLMLNKLSMCNLYKKGKPL